MSIRIVVLLSTYNGERYISEQIDSILSQESIEVLLLIRDDGSTDNTIAIMNEYKTNGNVRIITGENLGVGNSFMELLYESPDADFYAFADQDDIWLPEKLSKAIDMIKNEEAPVLYGSNQKLVDKDGKDIGLRYKSVPAYGFIESIFECNLAGCTMVMNKRLRNIILKGIKPPQDFFKNVRIHDAWVLNIANCIGRVYYDPSTYILYRQHENNVVGARSKTILQRIKGYMQVLRKKQISNYRSRTAEQLLISLQNCELEDEKKELLELIAGINQFKYRIKVIRNKRILAGVTGNKLLFNLKVISGII